VFHDSYHHVVSLFFRLRNENYPVKIFCQKNFSALRNFFVESSVESFLNNSEEFFYHLFEKIPKASDEAFEREVHQKYFFRFDKNLGKMRQASKFCENSF